jgi:hypothetical protein
MRKKYSKENPYVLDNAGRAAAAEYVKKWTKNALKATPMTPEERIQCVHLVKRLYAVADLAEPLVAIAPSPLVARFATGAACAYWYNKNQGKSVPKFSALKDAKTIDDVVYNQTLVATLAAIGLPLENKLEISEKSYFDDECLKNSDYILGQIGAAKFVKDHFGSFGLQCTKEASEIYQGGNMWSHGLCYHEFGREYVGIEFDGYDKYQVWEDLGKISGFRFLHEKFCIVSDLPTELHVNETNRPHRENGPYIKWADGSSIYCFDGVMVPPRWIEQRDTINVSEILKEQNVEKRAVGCQIIGWNRIITESKYKVIDDSGNDMHGKLIELTLEGLSQPGRFLMATCPRNGTIVEGVPYVSDVDNKPINSVKSAQAWRVALSETEFRYPEVRT